MKMQIENVLSSLLNLSFNNIGRAADLVWFGFGELVSIKNRRGEEKIVSKYSLHVQCDWRIVNDHKILIASKDIYIPGSIWSKEENDFKWETIGSTRFDERIEELINNRISLINVTSIKADYIGGVKIYFTEGHSLEIFPDKSTEDEFWRFIVFNNESSHFVITGRGIEE